MLDSRSASCRTDTEEPTTSSLPELNEKVVAVYKGVGQIMKRYTTGKVPKAFKIIPNLNNWEEVRVSSKQDNIYCFMLVRHVLHQCLLSPPPPLSWLAAVRRKELSLRFSFCACRRCFTSQIRRAGVHMLCTRPPGSLSAI